MPSTPEPAATESTPTKRAPRLALGVSIESSHVNASVLSTADDVLVDKYESDLVKIISYPLLVGAAADVECPNFQSIGDGLTNVELVLGLEQQLRDQDRVFFMLNGENEGIYLPWKHNPSEEACLLELAQTAAQHLGADPDRVANGLKLFSIDGLQILTADELDSQRIAHVLLDGQLWVWPGIKVGYVREIEGCTVTTQSLHPKVFTVEGFFSQEEADAIIAEGIDHISRSPVDSSDAEDGYHADRTSYTAFLDDSHFTRDFRVRSSRLARLPSPSYTEMVQLVRYETGQFYRNHEDYFESKVFVPTKELAAGQFEGWIDWASSKIEELREKHGDHIVPDEFQPGGAMFPDSQSTTTFQNALLKGFMEDAEVNNFFWHADLEWGDWIKENLEQEADNIIEPLLEGKKFLVETFTEDLYKWLIANKNNDDTLLEVLRNSQSAFDIVVKSWVKRAGDLFTYEKPKYLHHFEPNRFVTLFLYLNDCPDGGETIFPYSKERLVTGIGREDRRTRFDTMGHTASVNRQRRVTTGTLYGEPAGAATAPRGSYTPAQMQALYLSRGRPDMAFMSNQGHMPVDVPELQQTCTVKNHVNLKKASLKLQRSLTEPLQYALEFQLDATKPCRISVYLVATETIDADTGGSSFALVHADKNPVLSQHFPSGLGQRFLLNGGEKEENAAKEEDQEKHEQSLPLLDFSSYDPDELVYKADTTQFPLVIVLEVSSDKKRPQSQTTFCTFVKKGEDLWDIKMLKQKILVDGLTYELQEIYGIDGSVAAAPKTGRNGDGQTDTTQTAQDEIEIPEGAECIICLCEPRNTTILPCRHMCLCTECAEALRKSSSTCPICRTHVEALLQIRVEAKETTTTEAEEDKTEVKETT
ncbi:hypothetical protein JG688_00001195 [Phytophthora aleatoria]|uniref:RING-type E3 ubiquitin transferase n=1 Tax=Phytophthora aleatoria TaxID=2496075 RepID=A0A8J5JDL5_9STRA|nr:hypothetical protein JG688_00001195 [Phytophthora aleatoria]